jgi:hypothetical protein
MKAMHDRPMAAAGLISYRCRGRYGWIMIGALDNADAVREAKRSTDKDIGYSDIEVWNGTRYVAAEPHCAHHKGFEYDCIDCDDARREILGL